MFQSTELNDHLKTSHLIENTNEIFVEWNLNQPDNIEKIGNYRYRPTSSTSPYSIICPVYDPLDVDNCYTGATDSETVVDNGYDDNGNLLTPFLSPNEKMKLLYSIKDCVLPNRPRSGINKLLYLGTTGAEYGYNQYVDSLVTHKDPDEQLSYTNIARRPRYYMSSRYDQFKYWTSFRKEYGTFDLPEGMVGTQVMKPVERGISKISKPTGKYVIEDAAPFVKYKNSVPTNKIIVKMQTNVGDLDLGPFRINNSASVSDPLYGDSNRTVPLRWKIQILKNNNWTDAISFDENSLRSDGSQIIKSDGYVEIAYGINIPEGYEEVFLLVGYVYSNDAIPEYAPYGYAYILKDSDEDKGVLYISDGAGWTIFDLSYGWSIAEEDVTRSAKVVKKLSDPNYYLDESNKIYREFDFIDGIRIIAETMNIPNCTFDLIEFSPRLIANITEKTISFSITKTMSDLGTNSIPVGNLLAATGEVSIFDYDLSFNENNIFDENSSTGSIIAKHIDAQAKFIFFDIVKNVDNYDYYIPVKHLYCQGFPQVSDTNSIINISLRDMYFYLESQKAPEMLLTDVSLSYAITVLLDNIGFSNYVFKRVVGEQDLIIPFFFIGPDKNVAEILQALAMSAQCAMFFDEFNNFVIMSKNYILPSNNERQTDFVLYGQETVIDNKTMLPNIINLSSKDKRVYNNGQINYTTRYIQKSLGSIKQAPYSEEYKTYVYKPVLLWEVAGQQNMQTQNELGTQAGGFSLAAAPLNSTLSDQVPYVENYEVKNNIIDLGESVYWIGKYAGYLYANGEIIKFDSVEYYVQGVGVVWIKDNHEYQDYFSKLKFNGKMYPTGNIRIYCEPNYEVLENNTLQIKNGEVKEHGRGQFGTTIVTHYAGIDTNSEWISDNNIRGCIQSAKQYLFNPVSTIYYPKDITPGKAGLKKNISSSIIDANVYAKQSTRNGIIKNFLANKNITESEVSYYKTALSGSIQSSALIFNGPSLPNILDPSEFVSYAYKKLDKPYTHFGTRMRIIGKVESATNKTQTPSGSYSLYSNDTLSLSNPSDTVNIGGGSGGIAFGLNPQINDNPNTFTNNGYYYEIVALSKNNLSAYQMNNNAIYYTIGRYPEDVITVVNNDIVTATTTSQHSFIPGDSIIIYGLLDKDNTTNVNFPANGVFTITEVSADKKSFKYDIDSSNVYSTNIISASGNGTSVIYNATNSFKNGDTITVSGFNNTVFNLTNAKVDSATSSQFTVSSSANTKTVFSVTKKSLISTTATLTTNEAHGFNVGQSVTVSGLGKTFDGTYTITAKTTNTFSYTISIPIYNVIKKSLISNLATLTTSINHDFVVGQSITITGVDAVFNGAYTITQITTNTFSYIKNSSNISSTDVNPNGQAKTNSIAETTLTNFGTVTSGGNALKNWNIVSASGDGTDITYVVINDGMKAGQKINISGINPSAYNGVKTISSTETLISNISITNISSSAGLVTYTTSASHGFFPEQTVKITGIQNLTYNITNKQLSSNVATLTTSASHNLAVGDMVIITGVDNTFNGTYTITAKTSNTFSYQRIASNISSTAVSPTGLVTLPSPHNWESIKINTVPSATTFTIKSTKTTPYTSGGTVTGYKYKIMCAGTASSAYISGGSGLYIPNTTQVWNGGTVSKNIDKNATISNILFYKIVSGKNTSEIIKKQRIGNVVTLTTAQPHSFQINDQVTISGVDAALNGTFVITTISNQNNTFSYNTTTSGNIALADLTTIGTATGVENIAIPQVLWRGIGEILVDDGKFTGQTRLANNEKTTVYDLAVEYTTVGSKRRFYLYLNDKEIATVDDDNPLPEFGEYNNMALFVRGSSRCMFENVYALTNNYSENTSKSLQLPVSKIFDEQNINVSNAMKKYSISGLIQQTYLSGIGSQTPPKFNIYYDEFGTIMREVVHFNIKYDRAYPALYAKIAPVFNNMKGYSISQFLAGSYGAEFLIFNCIDKNLNLDDTSGNYLRIFGISFTQSTTYSLTVDDYFQSIGNPSDQYTMGNTMMKSIPNYKQTYNDIKNSRLKYGVNEFMIETPYIQTTDAANQTMDWIIKKVMYPKKTIGINTFATQTLQLGDIVSIDYQDENEINIISSPDTKYVIYHIDYKKDNSGLTNTLYLAEV